MSAILGVSIGAAGVRGVLRGAGPAQSEFVVDAGSPSETWDAMLASVRALAREHEASASVLSLRRDDATDAYSQQTSDGVVVAVEFGAQIRNLYESGVLADEQTVALVDFGASGTSVSVVDVPSGRVLVSRNTDALGGDRCDYLLGEYLTSRYGDPDQLTDGIRAQLTTDMRGIKEHLSGEPSVTLRGPFRGGEVTLWRENLDDAIRPDVTRVVDTALSVIENAGAHVDAVVAIGGGANMQIVRQSLFDAVAIPVFSPYQPELVAARGAASIAADLLPAPAPAPAPAEPVAPTALPRHSDHSQKKSARRLRSRYLGGLVAVLVAGGVATAVAAAADRSADDTPGEVVSTTEPSSGRPSTVTSSVLPVATSASAPSSVPSVSETVTSTSAAETTTSGAAPTTSRKPTSSSAPVPRAASAITTTASPVPTTTVPTTTSPRPTTTTTTVAPVATPTVKPTTTRPPMTTTKKPQSGN